MQLPFDFYGPAGRPDRYFFALMPDPEVARRIDGLARDLRRRLAPRAELRGIEKYHVTLWGIEDDQGPGSQIVERMRAVGSRLAARAFGVAFDHAADFGDRSRNPAFALAMSDGLPGAEDLQAALAEGMRRVGQRDRRSFKPHVTLFYHRRPVAPAGIPTLGWRADAFVLVRSSDRCAYAFLERWPLRNG